MNQTQSAAVPQHPLPPLAERMRPRSLDEFVGQEALVGKNRLIGSISKASQLFSMILWGPPGSGKTTLARIITKQTACMIYELSAVSSSVRDLRKIIEECEKYFAGGKSSCLFIDEIHRFNKAQQDSLLHAVEQGILILIGATTENPSFEVISPLLSRCQVLTLKPLTPENLDTILTRVFERDPLFNGELKGNPQSMEEDARAFLILSAGSDARKMLNSLEIASHICRSNRPISVDDVREALQTSTTLYDKTGDYHFDTVSALIKSVRGSCPDAALYWLAVMLHGGEKPEFIARRLIILASEDIGNADPDALPLAVSAFNAVHVLGMPEAAIILAQATVYLSAAPKSNASYTAVKQALLAVSSEPPPPVPLHLRNAPTKLMRSLDFGKDYDYPHDHKGNFTAANYFPEGRERVFYQPTTQGREAFIFERLRKLWPRE